MSAIAFKGVSKRFAGRDGEMVAIDHVDLEIADKEFVAICGPSGCGKTTLLRMAAGLDFPSAGSVAVGGRAVRGPGPDRAVVFQQFALLPWKTVKENIGFGLRCRGVPAAEREREVMRYVELMGLSGHENAYPHQLSGGMQQRVAIARSSVLQPDVLLMDEPFGALDAQTRVTMQEELIHLARRNPRTVLFITHSVEEAVYLADRVVVMSPRPGRIRETIEVGATRRAENWEALAIEDVMDRASFIHFRTHIWKLLRHRDDRADAAPSEVRLNRKTHA